MNNCSFNYVRTFRRRYALAEEDLAFLIDQRSQSAIAQFESGDRVPTLAQALALQVLFRAPPHRVFPGLYEDVEDGVMRRASELVDRLEGETDTRSTAKREFLESLARMDDNEEEV
jgi:DNA-binding XRE family transcriptional regulator